MGSAENPHWTPPTYTYVGLGYANPDAVTQIANGFSTSTFSYDADGNLAQKTVDGTTTTYIWDYANRLTALGVAGQGTTTYGYDAFGTRVYQIIPGTSTTTYPWKYFSVASTTKSGANYATSTEYVFNGDTLLATVDQGFKNGSATGTPITHYIHPDHLGSTNIVTDASGNVVQTLDYYPYGASRINQSNGAAGSKRNYIGQFSDDSGLSYLNARYMEPSRGQFISQDPSFLAVGNSGLLRQTTGQDQLRFLSDPQQINSYSYARDNPITNKDPKENTAALALAPFIPIMDFEAISGPIGWGALAITSLVAGAYVLSDLGQPNWQTSQLVDGNGGGSDPNRFNRPRGKWGGLILTTAVSAFIINRGVDVMQEFQSAGSTGSQWQRTQQLIQWGANPSSYAQSVAYSQATGKASNTNSGGGGGGGGNSYASQTYVVPSGAIVDWGGNVIVPAPPPPPPPPPPPKKN